jgi:hypothetical protein
MFLVQRAWFVHKAELFFWQVLTLIVTSGLWLWRQSIASPEEQ